MRLTKNIVSAVLAAAIAVLSAAPAFALEEQDLTAPSVLLMDAASGRVLFEKNPHEIRVCASITKVMTLLLVMEALEQGKIELTDSVTASEHAASMGGSDIWLTPGEVMTVDEMIKAVVVASANDAAVALAEHVAGSEEGFVNEMNQKAKSLSMSDTVFKNCNGLDEDGHVTSAYDVAVMSRELIKHRQIFDYTAIWMDYLRDGKTQLVNTNKLLKSYKGITGLKTGTTSKAGSCIAATAERDGLSLIGVVLGSATGKDRFKDAAKLLDYGFANFSMFTPEIPAEVASLVSVTNGMQNCVTTKLADIPKSILLPKGKERFIVSAVNLEESTEAPVAEGQPLGELVYSLEDEVIARYPIVAAETVPQMTFSSLFGELFRGMLTL